MSTPGAKQRCIGATLLTQKIASQESEGVIIANLINLWNAPSVQRRQIVRCDRLRT